MSGLEGRRQSPLELLQLAVQGGVGGAGAEARLLTFDLMQQGPDGRDRGVTDRQGPQRVVAAELEVGDRRSSDARLRVLRRGCRVPGSEPS